MARRAAALVAGAVMAGSLLAATPAVASPVSTASYDQCPANRFCMWTGLNGTGSLAVFASGAAQLPAGVDNNGESVRNRTGGQWCLYDGRNYTNLLVVVVPGTAGNLPLSTRNRVSSLRAC